MPTIPIASILGLYLIHKYNSNLEGYIVSKFIFKSSIKPSRKNNVQNDRCSKKDKFLKNKRLKKIINKEKNTPIPPITDVGDV